MPEQNETSLCLATNNELLCELTSRPSIAAIVVYVDRELKGTVPQVGDVLRVCKTPVITKQGVIGMLEVAIKQLRAEPG